MVVFMLFSLLAFVACSSTDDAGLQNGEAPDRSRDPSSEGTGSVPSRQDGTADPPPVGGSPDTNADTEDASTEPLSIEDLQVGVLTSEEVEDVLLLVNQAYEEMRTYRTNFNLFWDVSLNQIGGKEFLEQTNEIEVVEGLIVETFGKYFYEETLLNELSIERKEGAELATFNIGPYEYFVDDKSDVYFFIPSLVGQEFKFDSGQLAASVLVESGLRDGWIRANLESDVLVNEESFSFVRAAGIDLPRLMDPDFISKSLRQAKYLGEAPIMDELSQEEVQYDLFSFEFAYSDLATQDTSAALFSTFNDDLGISDEEVLSLASDVPVILTIYLDPEGVIRRIESTLNLSLILLEYFGGLQTSGDSDSSSSGIKFVIGSRQNFSDVGDPALEDEFVQIASLGGLPNTFTLDGVLELADILS